MKVERLSRDEDLSVGISSVFEDGSFYGRISNANKCLKKVYKSLMEEYPRCWKKIAKRRTMKQTKMLPKTIRRRVS